jgi:hypothetical protein
LLTLCPLGQPKKAIGHEPQIELWLTHDGASVSLARVSEIDLESRICFPSSLILSERSSPSRFRMAAPIGAPLTAPGRPEQHIPHMRESRDRKPATGQANMINVPRLYSQRTGEMEGWGWMPKFHSASARGGDIFLGIPPYRTIRGTFKIVGDPNERAHPGVNNPRSAETRLP